MNALTFTFVVLATLLLTAIVGLFRRGTTSFTVYAKDPKNHSPGVAATSVVGTIVGGGLFIGVGQIGYEAGIVGIIMGAFYIVGLAVVGALAPRIAAAMDKERVNSLLELLEAIYSARVAALFSFACLLMYFFLLAGQFVALYSFASHASVATNGPFLPWALVVVSGLLMLTYPVIGGLRKDIATDVIQVAIITLAAIILFGQVASPRALTEIYTGLPSSHLSGTGYGMIFLAGLALFLPISFLVRADIWQRIRTARSPNRLTTPLVLAGFASFLCYSLFTLTGMLARARGLPSAESATLDLISQVIESPVLLGVVIGALFAAVLSSADTFVNNVSVFAVRIFSPTAWHSTSEQELLRIARWAALGTTICAAAIAYWAKDMVDLMVGAFSLLVMFFPLILGVFVSSWRSPLAAFYSGLVGLISFALLFVLWSKKLAFAPAVILSIAVYAALLKVPQKQAPASTPAGPHP